MSIEAMSLVLHHSKASGVAQIILMGIANHMGDGGAYPSISTLAKYGKVSERRTQQIIRELETAGELLIENNSGAHTGTGQTNRYFVTISCPENCDGSMNHRSPRGEISSQGVKSDAPRGEISSTQGVKPISPKPLLNQFKTNMSEQIKTNMSEQSSNEIFEQFWKIYPRREKRAKALQAFSKAIKTHPPDLILAGATRYRDDPNRQAQFTRIPESWLNGECWLDDPLPAATKTENQTDPWAHL